MSSSERVRPAMLARVDLDDTLLTRSPADRSTLDAHLSEGHVMASPVAVDEVEAAGNAQVIIYIEVDDPQAS
ncbi:MAG: hypothetical protein Q7U41_01350, partial [Microbacterium sp.]|nr:hypothetical protein [Microbacterium sp.]